MAKMDDIRARFGGNLAESMGANRRPLHGAGGSAVAPRPVAADPFEGTERNAAARIIDVDRIEADPDQPRTEFNPDELDRLAASLARHGQIQPIVVRPGREPGRFIIVAGERRHRASIRAGRKTIAAVLMVEAPEPAKVFELQLIENCLRSDLKPIEQARAFRRIMDENSWSAARLGETIQVSESTIIKALANLTLPAPVQDAVEAGTIAPSVAYEVSKANPADQQVIADRAVAEGMNRAQVIEAVRQVVARKPAGQGGSPRTKKVEPGPATFTSRRFKGDGLKIEVTSTRTRGTELANLADALEVAAAAIRAEIAQAG